MKDIRKRKSFFFIYVLYITSHFIKGIIKLDSLKYYGIVVKQISLDLQIGGKKHILVVDFKKIKFNQINIDSSAKISKMLVDF